MPVCTLIYHKICTNPNENALDPFDICVTKETFSSHLRELQNHYNIIAESQILQALDPTDDLNQERCVLLTFDDGYKSSVEIACDYLSSHGVRAVAFISPRHVDSPENIYWWDILSDALGANRIRERESTRIRSHAMQLDYKSAHNFVVNSLAGRPVSAEVNHIADWKLLRRASEVFDFGVHGLLHDRFSALTVAQLSETLVEAKLQIHRELSVSPTSIAYPYGDGLSVTAEQIDGPIRKEFHLGFTAQKGITRSWQTNCRFQLPRYFVPEISGTALVHRLGLRFDSDAAQ